MTALQNTLTKQMGEHLVCAELARRGFLATTFSGNVPNYDLLVAGRGGEAIPIQVKAIKWGRKPQWRSDARTWMDIRLDEETGVQNDLGDKSLAMPDLIYVLVALAPPDPQPGKRDRFFILTMAELQAILARGYRSWMRGQGWRRPRTQDSYDIHYGPESVAEYEDNWDLITRRLQQ